MAKYVETRRCVNGAGHSPCVQRIAYAEHGFQVAVGNAGLCTLRDQIENCCSCRLRACPCSSGYCDEWMKATLNGQPSAERCIDEVEEVSVCEQSARGFLAPGVGKHTRVADV